MVEPLNGSGPLVMAVYRLHRFRLPRVMAMKDALDRGELLDEWSIMYLERVLEDAQEVISMVEKFPEYHDLYSRLAHFYRQVSDKALANAKQSEGMG